MRSQGVTFVSFVSFQQGDKLSPGIKSYTMWYDCAILTKQKLDAIGDGGIMWLLLTPGIICSSRSV